MSALYCTLIATGLVGGVSVGIFGAKRGWPFSRAMLTTLCLVSLPICILFWVLRP